MSQGQLSEVEELFCGAERERHGRQGARERAVGRGGGHTLCCLCSGGLWTGARRQSRMELEGPCPD